MPSSAAQKINEMFRRMQEENAGKPKDLCAERKAGAKRPKPEIPEGVEIRKISLRGIDAEMVLKAGNKDLVMYIHGGGFSTGAADERRELTQYIVDHCGYNVIANNYRLSPEHVWPAHLDDCMAAYEGILDLGYPAEQVIVMGESAGATLSLALSLRLRDEKKPMPKAVVAFSGCTEQAHGFPSRMTNIPTDYMLGDTVATELQNRSVFGEHWNDIEYLKHPYISPYYASYRGMPPVFLAVSDAEVFYDDSVKLYEKLEKLGHRCQLDVQHGVCHAYAMFPMMDEAADTLEKTFEFVREL